MDQIGTIIEKLLLEIGNADFNIILYNILGLISITGGLIAVIKKWYKYNTKLINSLHNALVGYSVVSDVELIYQIRCYRPPNFKNKKTIKQLINCIRESVSDGKVSTNMFSIVGSPACGKTTTMRYLYYKLSKRHKCVYFQMQHIVSMEKLSDRLKDQKIGNNLSDNTPVIAFFDGLDEAYEFFYHECPSSMEEAFKSVFFKDPEPKINEIFRRNGLNLVCIVTSFRPEFLEKSIHSLTSFQRNNVYQKVYEIVGMSDNDIIKIFKSLKVLKKLDSKLASDQQRHQKRIPPIWQEYKYVRLLRKILKDNPGCIFQYPMYIRYAYAFMQHYLERQAHGDKITLNNYNISVSFDILVDAIIKWEFHVYYGKRIEKKQEEMKRLTYQMVQCAQDIAVQLQHKKVTELSRNEFKQIIHRYFHDKASYLVMAHCFMISGDENKVGCFAFCHSTFQEYFLAKYLFEKADYLFRKECLCSDKKSEYLIHMYYSILCQNKQLNECISKSISLEDMKYTSGNFMTPQSYITLNEQKEVKLEDTPQITMVEIFEYVPHIIGFFYRGLHFSQNAIETILATRRLDLESVMWSKLDYAGGIISSERVESLNISWMPLTDIEFLKQYNNLKYLDIRFNSENDSILEKIYVVLRYFNLSGIHIYSETGIECSEVYKYVCNRKLYVQKIYVQTPNYSQAHIRMYELNKRAEKLNESIHFYLSVCTDRNRAKEKYLTKRYINEFHMLKAVFELELGMDNGGGLCLAGKDIESMLWNGMSLVECYKFSDKMEEAYQVCCKMEQHIVLNHSELSGRFGAEYGYLLFEKYQYKLAQDWLLYAYQYCGNSCCERMSCGLRLYEVLIDYRKDALDEIERFGTCLEERIMKLPNYQNDKRYISLLRLHCVRELLYWNKGMPQPESIHKVISNYRNVANNDREIFNAIYFEMICANRTENISLSEKLLEKGRKNLNNIMANDEYSEIAKDNTWIKYQEQRLYYLFLKDEKEMMLNVIDELLKKVSSLSNNDILNAIYSFYHDYDDTKTLNTDRHLLWDTIRF